MVGTVFNFFKACMEGRSNSLDNKNAFVVSDASRKPDNDLSDNRLKKDNTEAKKLKPRVSEAKELRAPNIKPPEVVSESGNAVPPSHKTHGIPIKGPLDSERKKALNSEDEQGPLYQQQKKIYDYSTWCMYNRIVEHRNMQQENSQGAYVQNYLPQNFMPYNESNFQSGPSGPSGPSGAEGVDKKISPTQFSIST